MKKTVILISMILVASCHYDDMRLAAPVELGAIPDYVLAPKAGGELQIPFYANLSGSISLLDDAPWMSLDMTKFDGDGSLKVNVSANEGIRRYTRVLFSADDNERHDTVTVRQEGLTDTLTLSSTSVIVYNKMGDTSVPASVSLNPSSIKAAARYLDTDEVSWVKACSVKENAVLIRTEDNPSAEKVRSAVLTLSWTNGWGQKIHKDINLTQATSAASGNHVGLPASFEDIRALASETSSVIQDNFYLEGYIVSDKASGNVTENPRRTSTSIDYSATQKSAVLESLDGRYGFMLETISAEDNIFEPFSKVTLLLSGAQLRLIPSPDRYVISNVRSSMVASSTKVGEDGIPSKNMHISELKDSDIYTRVTLSECEFPIRKGGLTPLNEGYTSALNVDRVSKFASLVRDKEGGSIYLFTNTTCPYRRDGRRIGNGSGPVKGIVVSEPYESFENVGRYQLRHQSWDDLGFAEEFSNGFSALACEWRYLRQGNADHSWNATAGNGTMTHTCTIGSFNSTYNTWCYPCYDQSYLGPVFKNCTNENGFGITLEDGSDYAASYKGSVEKGQLLVSAGWPMAWMRETWISNSGKFYSWEIKFSTKDIKTDVLSLQISTLNASQEGKSPVHWKVEWASSNAEDASWKEIATYSAPDVVLWSITQPWQSAGFKPVDIRLPLEMLDKEEVYIRFTPADTAGNTPQGYCDTKFVNGNAGSTSKANNALNYVAVRYNK